MDAPTHPVAARRAGNAAGVAALAVLAVLPAAMTAANRSAPAIVTLAAVLALFAAAADGRLGGVVAAARQTLRTPLGLAGLALIAVALYSLAWSHRPAVTLFALGEALLPAGAALALGLSLPRRRPGWIVPLFAFAFAIAAIDIVVELMLDGWLRRSLGLRPDAFVFNRSVVTLVVLAAPLALVMIERNWGRFVPAVVILLAAAVLWSHSGAATLGLAAGLVGLAIAAALPRVATALALAGLVAVFVLAPVAGELASRLVPDRVYDALASAHAKDRVAIWRSFGAAVAVRPLGGTGFGTSGVLAGAPVAREVPPADATLLGVGHPHNAFLQLWSELGLAGALAGGAFLLAGWRALTHLRGARFVTTYAFAVSAAAIALVGHGAWQGWWIASLGAGLVWLTLADAKTYETGARP